jgi:hypothetical protein
MPDTMNAPVSWEREGVLEHAQQRRGRTLSVDFDVRDHERRLAVLRGARARHLQAAASGDAVARQSPRVVANCHAQHALVCLPYHLLV